MTACWHVCCYSDTGDYVLKPDRLRTGDRILIVKCCVCGSIMGEQEENGIKEEISHTYCDHCLRELIDRNHEEEDVAELFLNR